MNRKFLTFAALLLHPAAALAEDPHLNAAVDAIQAEIVALSSKVDGIQTLLGWLLGELLVLIIAQVWAGGRR